MASKEGKDFSSQFHSPLFPSIFTWSISYYCLHHYFPPFQLRVSLLAPLPSWDNHASSFLFLKPIETMPTENMAEIILQQQWHMKRMDKERKGHTACENHPVSRKCKSHKNDVTGCWKGSWDVKVTLCYWTDCKTTSLKLQVTPGISNCSFEPTHTLLQLISG